ncbi:MAG: amidohydrolase family protein, partial [bacterium]
MDLARLIRVARAAEPADLLLTNARIVDVYNQDIISGGVAVLEDRIAAIAPPDRGGYDAYNVIDLEGAYVAPGFIDGHVHIESSMVTIPEFTRAVVPHGTTAVVT